MRLGEIKLHDLELIAGLVSIKHGDKYKYPGAEIQKFMGGSLFMSIS